MFSTVIAHAPFDFSPTLRKTRSKSLAFNVKSFLDSTGLGKTIATFDINNAIFGQGDLAKNVMYIQKGTVKLSVVSKTGKEAVVAMLKPGDFVGEGALAEGVCLLCSSVIIIGAFASEVTPSGSGVGADRTYHSNPPCNSNDNSIPVATLKRARVFR